MQERIYHKKTKNQTKTRKTGTRVKDGQKGQSWELQVNLSPSSIQIWQKWSLDYNFEESQI